MDPMQVASILRYLDSKNVRVDAFNVKATKDYELPPMGLVRDDIADTDDLTESMIPGLLHSYIRMGGRVIGEPALDRDFKCIDLFTVLNLSALDARYERKFLS